LSPVIEDTATILSQVKSYPVYEPMTPTSNPEDIGNFDKKLYLYNTSRVCEFELSQTCWYDYRYDRKQGYFFFSNHFSPFLQLVRAEFSGTDMIKV
jgi:hypothetical protein